MTKESYNFGVDTEARLHTETSGMTDERFTKGSWAKYPTLSVFDNKIGRELNSIECINILNELNDENEELKEKLNEILELTELTGMIHLRKAEIKSIIKR